MRTIFLKQRIIPYSAGAGIALLASFFLPVRGLPVSLCLFKFATGLPCPGCGLTRSLTCLSHGDLSHAIRYHPFGILAYLILVGFAVAAFLPEELVFGLSKVIFDKRLGIAFTFAFAGFAVCRMIGVATGYVHNIW